MKNKYFEKEPDYFFRGMSLGFWLLFIAHKLWLMFK